ncbi:hypothetical protein [Streptomyces sp. t39]|uniref:hypothetical protein n=1 Tax=Streptomyces sp. t39 TaxID=1828156 RepID=UPI0011CE0444|nr:hypothetical protein [Streptomyces sp. t39]TXS35074.1 hypothetical protein EAO77_37905 [Streptomyces sp. t39]
MADAYYSNQAVATTLTGSVSSGATSVNVAATTGFPGSFPYTLALDYGSGTEELVSVTAAAGLTLTVTRGFSGTSAQSHSLGAVVKHVYHAGDATDFRTHQDATSGVHGVSGALVGTTSTQTLTNKTLTAPAISAPTVTGGGSLAGTFTGTPTLSGAVLFTGTPIVQAGAASTAALNARVSGDSVARLEVRADGRLSWGSGAGAADTVLYREGTGMLTTDNIFRVYRAAGTDSALSVRVSGDANSRFQALASGELTWGAGGGSSVDTNLYRSAANTLKTDDALEVVGNISAANYQSGGWTAYSPVFSSTGTAPNIGNGTLTGRYALFGKTMALTFALTGGTTTTLGTGSLKIGVPLAAAGGSYYGVCRLNGADSWPGQLSLGLGATEMDVALAASATNPRLTNWTATTPEALGAGETLRGTIIYEVA